jgi:large subunit ribosomal protein L15
MRGGKGRAGGRKHFWLRTVKYEPERYRNKGFKPPSSKRAPPNIINLGELEHLVFTGQIDDNGGVIDLADMGFDKLLGQGSISKKYKIIIDNYSQKAKLKIEENGGAILSNYTSET